jgi:hypothetical protein
MVTVVEKTIFEQAQAALDMLNCSHPDGSSGGLSAVLARLDPDSQDAIRIKQAIDQLDELAADIARIEYELADTPFSFGKLEV